MSAPQPPLDVDGARPAVQWVTSLPQQWLNDGERIVLLVLALDSFDGHRAAPGRENLARWSGHWPSSNDAILLRLMKANESRPALLEASRSKGKYRTRYRLCTEVQPSGHTGGFNLPATPGGSYPQPSGHTGGFNLPATPGVLGVEPTGEPSGEPTGEPSGDAGTSLSLALPPTHSSSVGTSPRARATDDDERRGGEPTHVGDVLALITQQGQ